MAACERDAAARKAAARRGVTITHASYSAMLREVDCDVVACGEFYARRGAELIRALEAGKHVFGDKPLCTQLSELKHIEALAQVFFNSLRLGGRFYNYEILAHTA